jgi:hypothetical protein
VSRTLWVVLAVLCAWGFITIVRRIRDEEDSAKLQDGEEGSGHQSGSLKDSIDWEELQKAEDEVRDVDPDARPEDGFEGDDWGPGTVQTPKPPVA